MISAPQTEQGPLLNICLHWTLRFFKQRLDENHIHSFSHSRARSYKHGFFPCPHSTCSPLEKLRTNHSQVWPLLTSATLPRPPLSVSWLPAEASPLGSLHQPHYLSHQSTPNTAVRVILSRASQVRTPLCSSHPS